MIRRLYPRESVLNKCIWVKLGLNPIIVFVSEVRFLKIYKFKELKYWEGVTESTFLKDLLNVTLLLNPTS